MGLSDEERYKRAVRALVDWRSGVRALAQGVSERRRPVVRGWVATIDQFIGELLLTVSVDATYWMCGAIGVSSLLARPREAQPHTDDPTSPAHPVTLSAEWWLSDASVAHTARMLQHGRTKWHGLTELGAWWDSFAELGAVGYSIWRYQDRLFPRAVRVGVRRLVGEMFARRFEVCELSERDGVACEGVEAMLLGKHQLVLMRLDALEADSVRDHTRNAPIDGSKVYDAIAALSPGEVQNLLDAEERRHETSLDAIRRKDREAEDERANGVLGRPATDAGVGTKPDTTKAKAKAKAKRG